MALQHDFWLLRENEYQYASYQDFCVRDDAPVSLADNLLRYVFDTLLWVPTLNPAKKELPAGHGKKVVVR